MFYQYDQVKMIVKILSIAVFVMLFLGSLQITTFQTTKVSAASTFPTVNLFCPLKQSGDADCDGGITLLDFEQFRKEYVKEAATKTADFDGNGSVDLLDFEVWRQNYTKPITGTPTATKTPTPQPSIPKSNINGKGIWISPDEILRLHKVGQTWNDLLKKANGNVGTADLSNLDSTHPENTLALALVSVRLNDSTLLQKTVTALNSAIGTENNPDPLCASSKLGARSLSISRNLIGYIVAADIINYRKGGYDPNGNGTKFQQWIDYMRIRKNCDNNGQAALTENITEIHDQSTSNGNTMAGASRIAADAYLGDKIDLDKAWLTFRRYAGDTSVGPNFSPNSFSANWKATNPPSYIGVNPKGARCSGSSSLYLADGVLPNDQGRGGDCPSNPNSPPGYTAYPWEGLQGAYAQALILDRMGYKDPQGKRPWEIGDNALLRAVQYQYYLQTKFGGSWYDTSRAAWVKHLAYYIYSYKPMSYAPDGGGRNMDWTQWTHQK